MQYLKETEGAYTKHGKQPVNQHGQIIYVQPVLICSVRSLDQLGHQGGHVGQFSRDPLPLFSAGSHHEHHHEHFWHGQGYPLFNAVHPIFADHGVVHIRCAYGFGFGREDGLGEVVKANDMPEPDMQVHLKQ